MRLPDRVQDITAELYNRNLALAHGDEDQRRQLARMIAEQARYELGPSWGHKRADPGRPPSKDAIAQQQSDGTLLAWDLFNGATREPNADPESIDITGQTFIVVPPVNHLGLDAPVEPAPGPTPEPEPHVCPDAQMFAAALGELASLRASVDAARADTAALRALIAQLVVTTQPVTFPTYTGTINIPFVGTRTITLRPE